MIGHINGLPYELMIESGSYERISDTILMAIVNKYIGEYKVPRFVTEDNNIRYYEHNNVIIMTQLATWIQPLYDPETLCALLASVAIPVRWINATIKHIYGTELNFCGLHERTNRTLVLSFIDASGVRFVTKTIYEPSIACSYESIKKSDSSNPHIDENGFIIRE
jgi:hypothetical protein